MLKVSSVTPVPVSKTNTTWLPGARIGGFAVVPPSKRTTEIAKSREELLRLLHDVPESEFELSLTDLVERIPAAGADHPVGAAADDDNAPSADEAKSNRASTTAKRRKKELSSNSNKRSFRSRSDGVLLKFYVPTSLTRSLTAPRPSRGPPLCRPLKDFSESDGEAPSFGCWSALWSRRGKSTRPVLETK